jgi:N-acetylneuraminate lyase
MPISQLSGIMPAIVTPFDAAGRFRADSFEKLIDRLYAAGVDGLYVCGQTGEGLQQPVTQRQEVAEAAVRSSPKGKIVILHVGAHTTQDAVALARHAGRCGAHAVSSLPPAGSFSFEEIRQYYRDLASASDLPLLVYYFPSVQPALRTLDQMLELCAIPNVVGLKFTDSDMFRLWSLRRSGAVIFNGSDEMLVAGLVMGANGGIGSIYNLLPASFAALYRHAVAGDWNAARAVQDRINEFIAVILRFPVNPAVKVVLRFTGIDCGDCVEPRRRLTEAEENDLRASLSATALGAELLGAGVGTAR